jgi:hypothetical protein
VGILQVTDAVGSFVRLRVLVSGVDGPTVFDLRCEVREALVNFLQREHPDALPRIRVDDAAPARRSADQRADDDTERIRFDTGLPVEQESEATHSQGLFTGSMEAAERARGFTGPSQHRPSQ